MKWVKFATGFCNMSRTPERRAYEHSGTGPPVQYHAGARDQGVFWGTDMVAWSWRLEGVGRCSVQAQGLSVVEYRGGEGGKVYAGREVGERYLC